MTEQSAHQLLNQMTRSLRSWVQWDAEDGVPGYPLSAAVPATQKPATSTTAPVVAPSVEPERLSLEALQAELGQCTRCTLSASGRTQIVYGEGNSNADLVFVGEAPSEQEDQQGQPFVGEAGKLLDKMLAAMGLTRSQVYVCNVVKCHPPQGREPEAQEVSTCQPFLRAQIRSIQPKVVVTMGQLASQVLLNSTDSITTLRGRFHDYSGIQLMPTFHPATLILKPAEKRTVWGDLQQVMNELGLKNAKD